MQSAFNALRQLAAAPADRLAAAFAAAAEHNLYSSSSSSSRYPSDIEALDVGLSEPFRAPRWAYAACIAAVGAAFSSRQVANRLDGNSKRTGEAIAAECAQLGAESVAVSDVDAVLTEVVDLAVCAAQNLAGDGSHVLETDLCLACAQGAAAVILRCTEALLGDVQKALVNYTTANIVLQFKTAGDDTTRAVALLDYVGSQIGSDVDAGVRSSTISVCAADVRIAVALMVLQHFIELVTCGRATMTHQSNPAPQFVTPVGIERWTRSPGAGLRCWWRNLATNCTTAESLCALLLFNFSRNGTSLQNQILLGDRLQELSPHEAPIHTEHVLQVFTELFCCSDSVLAEVWVQALLETDLDEQKNDAVRVASMTTSWTESITVSGSAGLLFSDFCLHRCGRDTELCLCRKIARYFSSILLRSSVNRPQTVQRLRDSFVMNLEHVVEKLATVPTSYRLDTGPRELCQLIELAMCDSAENRQVTVMAALLQHIVRRGNFETTAWSALGRFCSNGPMLAAPHALGSAFATLTAKKDCDFVSLCSVSSHILDWLLEIQRAVSAPEVAELVFREALFVCTCVLRVSPALLSFVRHSKAGCGTLILDFMVKCAHTHRKLSTGSGAQLHRETSALWECVAFEVTKLICFFLCERVATHARSSRGCELIACRLLLGAATFSSALRSFSTTLFDFVFSVSATGVLRQRMHGTGHSREAALLASPFDGALPSAFPPEDDCHCTRCTHIMAVQRRHDHPSRSEDLLEAGASILEQHKREHAVSQRHVAGSRGLRLVTRPPVRIEQPEIIDDFKLEDDMLFQCNRAEIICLLEAVIISPEFVCIAVGDRDAFVVNFLKRVAPQSIFDDSFVWLLSYIERAHDILAQNPIAAEFLVPLARVAGLGSSVSRAVARYAAFVLDDVSNQMASAGALSKSSTGAPEHSRLLGIAICALTACGEGGWLCADRSAVKEYGKGEAPLVDVVVVADALKLDDFSAVLRECASFISELYDADLAERSSRIADIVNGPIIDALINVLPRTAPFFGLFTRRLEST